MDSGDTGRRHGKFLDSFRCIDCNAEISLVQVGKLCYTAKCIRWIMAAPLPDVFTASCAAKSSNASYAGMMKLVDMRDLGDVTSVKVFRPIIRRTHSLVKAGPSCFYRCGSSVTLRLGSSPCKNQRRIK